MKAGSGDPSIEEFYQDPALLQAFLVESEELLQGLDQDLVGLEKTPDSEELLNRIFRALHTIKGAAGFLGFHPIVQLGHCTEDVLNALRRRKIHVSPRLMTALLAARDRLGEMLADLGADGLKPRYETATLIAELEQVQKASELSSGNENGGGQDKEKIFASSIDDDLASSPKKNDLASHTMRVDVRKLDDLINMIGELVLERNRLLQLAKEQSSEAHAVDSPLSHSTARLSFITEELQAAALRTRMVPIDTIFCRFPRLVRDLSHALSKETDLVIRGQETEIDRTMVELVSDPLVHLVRNSLDHGLESPDQRVQAGKPRKGTICIEARQEGDRILVSVSDDGAGIDPARILGKAIEGDKLKVKPDVQSAVTFSRLNLLDDAGMLFIKGVDLILCCNVLIYFDAISKKRVNQHFYTRLLQHGYLFLGHSESLFGVSDEFRLVHLPLCTAYIKSEKRIADQSR
jgi:two-component system chemotaxis sensor kinase CheA